MENKKIVVAVIVYDRIGNFIKWGKIAKLLEEKNDRDFYDLEFRIIHNTDDPVIIESWKKISESFPVTYLNRKNVGMDIGAFQEICENRFTDFKNDFDFLVWFTDDCFPTDPAFLSKFINPFLENPKVEMTCFEVSKQIRPHARTTGFCLRRETLASIVFPVKVINTKQDCYNFEHGQNNLYLQINKRGARVEEIKENIFYNPDSPKVKRYGLEKSLENLYKFIYSSHTPDALVFSTAYNRFPQIVSSVFASYHTNTFLKIWHDGKIFDPTVKKFFKSYEEMSPLFEYYEIGETAAGNYGHHLKKTFLNFFEANEFEYILITNEDNYISPYFIKKAVETLERFPEAIGAYCNGMVHNYKPDNVSQTWKAKKTMVDGHIIDGYGHIPCKIERGYIDISSILFRASVAKAVSWGDYSHSSDWNYIENVAAAFGGKEKFVSFPGIHFIHN